MSRPPHASTRHWRRSLPLLSLGVGLLALAATMPASSRGQAPEPIIRVEEDWTLVLNEPKSAVNAPQFHTVMSPYGNLDGYFGQVTWNYRELPVFTSGGLQIQIWDGANCLRLTDRESGVLSTVAETITWTQGLETNGQDLSFSVIKGQSITWGTFGGHRAYLNANVPDLDGYASAVSTHNSWITYGANRVTLLAISQVRRYSASGLVSIDSEPKVVYEFSEG